MNLFSEKNKTQSNCNHLRLNNNTKGCLALPLQEPLDHMTGHERSRLIQFEQFAIVAQRPGRAKLKGVRNGWILALISRNRTQDSGNICRERELVIGFKVKKKRGINTQGILCEDVVQYTVGCELQGIGALAQLGIEHL